MKTSWQHGDLPSATILNEYRDSLIAAHDALGDLAGWSVAQENISEASYVLLHTWRYLHFVSNGELLDIYSGNKVDINEDESGQGRLDLDTIDWLVYGSLYRVTGVTLCIEDWAT